MEIEHFHLKNREQTLLPPTSTQVGSLKCLRTRKPGKTIIYRKDTSSWLPPQQLPENCQKRVTTISSHQLSTPLGHTHKAKP